MAAVANSRVIFLFFAFQPAINAVQQVQYFLVATPKRAFFLLSIQTSFDAELMQPSLFSARNCTGTAFPQDEAPLLQSSLRSLKIFSPYLLTDAF